ncbi:hypothetical protein C4J85_1485 [Pseudomonas sp. R4-34-07]|uniref:hypothetical protein n=1 Tax=Pseudomonas sp. R4-34-07 TaxID=658642 RepID=UPI000F563204|nr:hypothetical protein [Pseudomonas sp. R4-34-07]AZF51984.1 hypothetical protein C4J85_1485 [Pseudomonas sp. R4-34-07]
MVKNDFLVFVLIEYFVRLIERWRSKSIPMKAAASTIFIGGTLLAVPWQEILINNVFALEILSPKEGGADWPVIAGCFLIVVGVFFWVWACFEVKQPDKEKLINDKWISSAVNVSASKVYCYCGNISFLSDIDVVVASENTDFELGGAKSISVSGRLRAMAASRDEFNQITRDNLEEWVIAWKEIKGKKRDFNLGLCIECNEPYETSRYGIKSIIFAIAISKNDTGIAFLESASIRDIIKYVVDYCVARGFKTVFIPVFGLGKGNCSRSEALDYTLSAIYFELKRQSSGLDVYVGVYRLMDVIKLGGILGKWK